MRSSRAMDSWNLSPTAYPGTPIITAHRYYGERVVVHWCTQEVAVSGRNAYEYVMLRMELVLVPALYYTGTLRPPVFLCALSCPCTATYMSSILCLVLCSFICPLPFL